MTPDLPALVRRERPYWQELQTLLSEFEAEPERRVSIEQALRIHYLERRATAALSKLGALPVDSAVKAYLEQLLAQSFVLLGQQRLRNPSQRARLQALLSTDLPAAFRRHLSAFGLAFAITLLGGIFGAAALAVDLGAKEQLLPFSELLGDPRDRVLREESSHGEASHAATFAAILMANNISVAFRAFALGALYGLGTVAIIFYNGVVLGVVAYDYVRADQTAFLLGWLLPHGAIEVPAVLIAAQAGFVLGGAVLGYGDGSRLAQRLRSVGRDVATLLCGAALLLVWAGLVESFFSQYHAPVLPYFVKIVFGLLELGLLAAYLLGRGKLAPEAAA